ncbi:MAG: Trk system potassium transporter TrkA [Ruminococcus sp.]|uniref:Trk system potassium transporter TrkA n=1 Tax=Ruminococcus sp. TaxID=41978 RepID=UPI0028730942|nr:Trk system potassium transporter TrkA [Ruminococcus sp.]MBQ3285105.1 Trk system potassium transporter TrkA [Ruminococcus sp.]
MNIIIVGCGRVGRSIAEQLNMEGHAITVIDENVEALERLTDTQNVMAIEGNGATYSVLHEAEIENCDLLIAVTPTDELNLYTCLLAKNAGVPSTIARVRNPEYINDVEIVKDDLKLTLAINPEYTCASEIARLVKYPGAIKISSFAKGMVDFIKIRLTDSSPIAGKRVADCASLLKGMVRIVFVERDGDVHIPTGDFVLHTDDMVSFVAPAGAAAKLLRQLGTISNKGRSVYILGGSKIGFYLAKILRVAGVNVKIIEKDPHRCEELSEGLDGVMIINADAMDEDLLLSEHIERADGVVCLMDTDEENLLASLYVKKVNPKAKVVTELGNLKFSSVVDTLPLDSVIRPKQLTGESIVRYVRGMQNAVGNNVETMYKVNGDRAEALEFIVRESSAVTGVPLSKLNLKNDLQIVCISRGGRVIMPGGGDTIEPGDRVIVITKHKGLSDLRDILK